jgi:branched-chain amino acid transport system substrate-binding protein
MPRLAGAAVCLAAVAACTGSDADPAADTSTTTTTIALTRPADGRLLVGVMVPREGSGVTIGSSVAAGVSLASAQINNSGGVNGVAMEVVTADEPEDPAAARIALDSLITRGVDAIVGPASSLNALALVTRATDAGVLTCSPTASALALDGVPDSGLFFRTIPSDSLQALALAETVDQSGSASVTVVHLDDEYGRGLAAPTLDALAATNIVANVVATSGAASDLDETAMSVVEANNDTVVVIADAVSGPQLVASIDRLSGGSLKFIVNDAMRRPNADVVPYEPSLARRVRGVSPLASPDEQFLAQLRNFDASTSGAYATNAYDCVNLIALASATSTSDQPRRMADVLAGLTSGGTGCATFAECVESLKNRRNFQYNGPNGVLDIGRQGDLVSAVYEVFSYDDSGRDISDGEVVVSS